MKKCIYQLEKRQHNLEHSNHDLEANEQTSLIPGLVDGLTDAVFIPLLDRELKKIASFYESQEKELLKELDVLEDLVKEQDEADIAGSSRYTDYDGDEDDDEEEAEGGSAFWGRDRRRHKKSVSFGRRTRSGE